jgi:hypothetical protein
MRERAVMGEGAEGLGGGTRSRSAQSLPAAHWPASLLAFAVALAVLSLWSGSADALLHRGHSFKGSFETPTEGNKLSKPSAVAVNETSGLGAGDIYVADAANNRIVRFSGSHEFLEAWGYGVRTGAATFEKCTSEAECKAGIAGTGAGQFSSPDAIAVDNAGGSPSAGYVYVIANNMGKHSVIDKFNYEGVLQNTLTTKNGKEQIDGVAVDRTGTVWVDSEDGEESFRLERFTNALKNQRIGEPEEVELPAVIGGGHPAQPGFAIDSLGHAYITYEPGGLDNREQEELIKERAEQRKLKKEEKVEEVPAEPCVEHRCVVAQFQVPAIGEEGESEVVNAELNIEGNASGIAVDLSSGTQSSNDAYLDLGTAITAFTSDGTAIQTFGEQQLAEGSGSGLTVDATTGEVLVADAKHGRIDVYEPSPPGPPAIEESSLTAAAVTSGSAKLKATIDPSGADTHYRFRYGPVPCAGGSASCETTTDSDLGSAFGDQQALTEVEGLAPSTTYHFVVIAESALESGGKRIVVESQTEGSFTTLAAGVLEQVLPDGRAWELVSPVDKRGVSVEPLAHEGGLIQASADGKGIAYIAAAPVGEEEPAGNRAPEPAQLLATRGSAGDWKTRNLTTPNLAAQGINANSRREYQFFSSDLSLGAVFPVEPLAASETTNKAALTSAMLYLRHTGCAAACNQALSTSPVPGISFEASTPDLKHIGLITNSGLMEWSQDEAHPEGAFTTVSILPTNEAATGEIGFGAPEAQLFEGSRNTISQDGSRVNWSRHTPGGTHIYQSEVHEGDVESVQLDTPNEGESVPTSTVGAAPVYMTASATGSRVFFTDDQRLTANASVEEETAGDLYVYERDKPASERLTDLTPDLNKGESAAIQGGVIGASSDGSYVYFVANGVLTEDAQPGLCIPHGLRTARCNLYVVHNNGTKWEQARLVARISNEDGPDWAPSLERIEYRLTEMTARVSPSGQYLAFMSSQRLTPYNNTDANSGAADEEVYLYDAAGEGHVSCASCNPSGAQPVGIHDVQESGEGRGLLVDRLGIWSTESEDSFSHWLAGSVPGWTNLDDRETLYQSRYLSDNGRLFFNSPDALSSQDSNGKEDVYEYEPAGVGNCASEIAGGGCVSLISSGKSEQESAFLDASEAGQDVFFLTSAPLSAQDPDKAFDIYDARVCAGAEEGCPVPPPAPVKPCEEEGCRGGTGGQSVFGAPASTSVSGSGNVPPQGAVLGTKQTVKAAKPLTRAQKLAAALKSCKKKYKNQKRKRAACEKQARKKYEAKKSTAKRKPATKSSSTVRR